MQVRRTLVIAVLSLLDSAAPGHAEGKWVLWHEMSGAAPSLPKNPQGWSGCGQSFTSEAVCERELRDILASIAKSEPMSPPLRSELTVQGNVASMKLYRGNELMSTQSLRLVCQPDTVDPRGVKGN